MPYLLLVEDNADDETFAQYLHFLGQYWGTYHQVPRAKGLGSYH